MCSVVLLDLSMPVLDGMSLAVVCVFVDEFLLPSQVLLPRLKYVRSSRHVLVKCNVRAYSLSPACHRWRTSEEHSTRGSTASMSI